MRKGDPGLQPERTSAAWTRTGMALVCNAVLLARSGLAPMNPVLPTIALGIGAGCVALFTVQARERKLLATGHFVLPAVEVRIAAGLTVIVSTVAAYGILR